MTQPQASARSDPVALDGLPWCPCCGLGQWGRCERCRGGIGALGVVERVFCRSVRHGRRDVCPDCGRGSGRAAPAPTPAPVAIPGDPPELIVLDTETTGLHRQRDRVVQLAAAVVHLPACTVSDARSMLLHPGTDLTTGADIEIPWQVSKIHGIYAADVAGKATLEAILPRFLAWVAGRPIAAYNASFDRDFLRESLDRIGLAGAERPHVEVFDVLAIARAALPALKSHKLGEVARHLGVDTGRAHRADSDVTTTVAILAGLLARTGKGLRELHGKADTL